jgi:hypothetical protein
VMLGPVLGTGEATDADHDRRADAVLYELTEHAVITPAGSRDASASLHGTSRRGSLLCPEGLQAYAKEFYFLAAKINVKLAPRCSVVAIGQSVLDVNRQSQTFGAGKISGEFWVVMNSDATNKVDAQELFVMSGEFSGQIEVTDPDLSIITITSGTFTPTLLIPNIIQPALCTTFGICAAPFTGTFRLPFKVHHRAVYKKDNGHLVGVRPDEHALGKPTVRLEVTFD